MHIELEFENTSKINKHIETLEGIADSKRLSPAEWLIMFDTIRVFQEIRKQINDSFESA